MAEQVTISNQKKPQIKDIEVVTPPAKPQPAAAAAPQPMRAIADRKRRVTKAVPPELREQITQLKKYARALSKENSTKLTTCLRCDQLGYARYRVRSSNFKLILTYYHKNLPPKGTKRWGKHIINEYKECWIGNVVSESELLNKVKTTTEEQEKRDAAEAALTGRNRPRPRAANPSDARPQRVRRGQTTIALGEELMKKLHELRGKKTMSEFLRELLSGLLDTQK